MKPIVLLAGAALTVVFAVGAASYILTPGSDLGAPAPAPTPVPSESPSVAPSVAPSADSSLGRPTVLDTRTFADEFALPMKVTLPEGWNAFHDIKGTLGLVNMGVPPGPDSTWWGPDLMLVEDAQIHDPSSVVSSEPATSSRDDFVPWPDDFFAYITGLPGVEVVSEPEPITIGGVTGEQIDVKTPDMHPLVWMAGDYTWLGGGKTGVDPAGERRFVVLEKDGHTLLISLYVDPATFEERSAEVETLLGSITFE